MQRPMCRDCGNRIWCAASGPEKARERYGCAPIKDCCPRRFHRTAGERTQGHLPRAALLSTGRGYCVAKKREPMNSEIRIQSAIHGMVADAVTYL